MTEPSTLFISPPQFRNNDFYFFIKQHKTNRYFQIESGWLMFKMGLFGPYWSHYFEIGGKNAKSVCMSQCRFFLEKQIC